MVDGTVIELTEDSHYVFMIYAEDADNWGGVPWVSKGNIYCTREMRGNLSDLVQKGLIQCIYDSENKDCAIYFTQAGVDYADRFCIELPCFLKDFSKEC